MQTHPETADQTYAKQLEINETWQQLTTKANSRKEKLLDSYDLQRFLSDYRDLMSWINSMMGLVANDELGRDVTSAEALLERHQVNMRVKTYGRIVHRGFFDEGLIETIIELREEFLLELQVRN